MAERLSSPLVRRPPSAAGALLSIALLGPEARLSFRGGDEAATACGKAFGCPLPRDACRSAQAGDRAALWLGPDEWLLLAPEAETGSVFAAIEAALATLPHALVDVSHRQVGFAIAGDNAVSVLNTGCPLDLGLTATPIGMCTRTILAKAEITLWRRGAERFKLEVNRSFADYVAAYLRMAERGL